MEDLFPKRLLAYLYKPIYTSEVSINSRREIFDQIWNSTRNFVTHTIKLDYLTGKKEKSSNSIKETSQTAEIKLEPIKAESPKKELPSPSYLLKEVDELLYNLDAGKDTVMKNDPSLIDGEVSVEMNEEEIENFLNDLKYN
jgi:hypothetical protein